MALFSKDLGIDLGTVYTRISEGGEVVLQVPTIVAVEIETQRMIAVGEEALSMVGRVSAENFEVTRPLRNGVVAYYEYTEFLLRVLIKKVTGSFRLSKPNVLITYPHDITSVERRAVHEAALEIAASAEPIPQPLAAAIGIDLPINTPTGNMIVNLGGGCTQAAVIALYEIVSGETLRQGGLTLDDAIITYVRRKFGLIIEQPTAETIKLRIGAAVPQDQEKSIELQGQDQVTGLPRSFTITTSEVVEALQAPLDAVFDTVRRVLEKTQPELASDIIDRGIALCGGGSLLPGIDKLMTKKLGVPSYRVDNPIMCTAEGADRAYEIMPLIRRNLPRF